MNPTLLFNTMTAKALELLAMPEDEFNRRNETELAAEIERLRARVTELEAIITIGHGTMGAATLRSLQALQPDEPATITHGHTPNAPPHDE